MADEPGANDVHEVTLEPTTAVVRSRRPRALWGVLAAAVVAVGALAVSAGGGEGGPPRLPVTLGASTARSESDAAMAADSMLMSVTYRADDDLPAMGGSAAAYRLAGGYDEAAIAALHAALGIDGAITEQDGFWQARGSDGRYVEVFDAPGLPWWYSHDIDQGGSNAGGGSSGSPGDADIAVSPAQNCVEPAPGTASDCRDTTIVCESGVECRDLPPIREPDPADLPSEDEARRIALDFLAAAGVEVEGAHVTVEGPYDAWYVSVEPRVDGVPVAGLSASAAVGSGGVVTTASGYLASPERLDDYPLIDTRAAIDRLSSQQGAGSGADTPAIAREAAPEVVDDAAATIYEVGCEPADAEAVCVGTDGDPGQVEPDVGVDVICVAPAVRGGESGTTTGADVDSEECQPEPCLTPGDTGCIAPDVDPCYQAVPPQDDQGVRTEPEGGCGEPVPRPKPMPLPEPEPIEVVLTDVEPALVMLPADDGTTDSYLVPGYRFSNADGHVVEVAAVAEEALSPAGTDTTVPDTVVPEPTPVDPPDNVPYPSCETLVEEDPTGTTHTIQPCPTPPSPDPVHLEPGTEPAVGVGYYVDIDLACPVVMLGSTSWVPTDDGAIRSWSVEGETHEGGTFTIKDDETAHFQGDAAGTKQATFRKAGPTDDYFCTPTPRP